MPVPSPTNAHSHRLITVSFCFPLAVFHVGVCLVLAFGSWVAAQGDETVGAFVIVYDKDVFTDANRSFALNMPTDFRTGWQEENHALSFTCLADGLNVVVLWGKFFGGDREDRVEVRYRFDDRPSPAPLRWKMFAKSESARHWAEFSPAAEGPRPNANGDAPERTLGHRHCRWADKPGSVTDDARAIGP